jgi:hypothetical protein
MLAPRERCDWLYTWTKSPLVFANWSGVPDSAHRLHSIGVLPHGEAPD